MDHVDDIKSILHEKKWSNFVYLLYLQRDDVKIKPCPRRCAWCCSEICCYSPNVTYKTWYDCKDDYRYVTCQDNMIHAIHFEQSHMLIKTFLTQLLCHDVYRVVFDFYKLLYDNTLAPCYIKKRDYLIIDIKNKTVNQLKQIINERGLIGPKRAKKEVYQRIIQNDIDAMKVRWGY